LPSATCAPSTTSRSSATRRGEVPQPEQPSLYAIANEDTYLGMPEGAGLSPERYAGWLSSTLEAILLSGPAPP
jgi:hypothetical protein